MENINNLCEKDNVPLSVYLSIIHRQYRIFLNNSLEKEGVNAAQVPVLIYLLKHESACQDEMATQYKIDKGSIARSVRKLEELELIYKEIDPDNRRKYILHLTDSGKELAKKIWEIDEKWENIFYSKINLTKEEIEQVVSQMTLAAININENNGG